MRTASTPYSYSASCLGRPVVAIDDKIVGAMNSGKGFLTITLGATAACALLFPGGLRAAGCGQIKPDSTDAVTAAPATDLPATDGVKIHDPNISVVLENAYVRVLSVRVPPGEKEPWHTHTWPAVVVYFRLPPSQRLTPDGKKTPRAELKEMQITF